MTSVKNIPRIANDVFLVVTIKDKYERDKILKQLDEKQFKYIDSEFVY